MRADAYRRNPLFRVIEHGETFRGRIGDPATADRFPLMAELARQGFVDYVALPLRAGGAYHNAAMAATRRPGGFSSEQFAALQHLLRIFALHVERHIARRIAANVLDTYLGAAAGGRVLDGLIKRGAGESILSIVWASDLRGFTDLADRLAAALDALAALERMNAGRRPSSRPSRAGSRSVPVSPCTTVKSSSAMSVRRSGSTSR